MKSGIFKSYLALSISFWSSLSNAQQDLQDDSLQSIFNQYDNIRDFTIGDSGEDAYFTILSPKEEISIIVKILKKNNKWEDPEITEFSGKFKNLEPFLNKDGLRLYFSSNRPVHLHDSLAKDFDIWFVERKDSHQKWSKPINIGLPVNSSNDEFYPSLAANRNLYFTSASFGSMGKDDIFSSNWDGEKYGPAISLPATINTEGYEFNAYISPDETVSFP